MITKKKFGFFIFPFYLCVMNEVEEFLSWTKTKRQSLDSIINKLEERLDLDEDDFVFLEKIYPAFNEGSF